MIHIIKKSNSISGDEAAEDGVVVAHAGVLEGGFGVVAAGGEEVGVAIVGEALGGAGVGGGEGYGVAVVMYHPVFAVGVVFVGFDYFAGDVGEAVDGIKCVLVVEVAGVVCGMGCVLVVVGVDVHA